jgi:hypothetical protein
MKPSKLVGLSMALSTVGLIYLAVGFFLRSDVIGVALATVMSIAFGYFSYIAFRYKG